MNSYCLNVLIVLGSHLAHIVSIGMGISFGILYSEIKTELGTSHAETAWIVSLFNGLLGLVGLPLGVLLHKVHERWFTVAGTVFLVAGMVSSSFASKISTLYVTYGLISGVGAGIVHCCANTIIVRHFNARWCPLALTIANSGAAVSSLVFPSILTACIQGYGWKTTFLVLSGTSAVGLFSAACFVPQQNDTGKDATNGKPQDSTNFQSNCSDGDVNTKEAVLLVVKNCKFMMFFASSFAAFTVLFVPTTFLPVFMRYARYSSQEISISIMISGFGNLIGRLLSGFVAFKFYKRVHWIHTLTLLGLAVSTTLMVVSNSLTSVIALSILSGLFSGGYFGLHTAVIAHYLNKPQVPFGFGMINTANGIAIVTGMPLAGFVSDQFDGEDGSFVFGGGMMFIATVIMSINVVIEYLLRDDRNLENEIEITRL